MITAKQAYEKHLKIKNFSPIEKFVYSVLEKVITDKHILDEAEHTTEIKFPLREILQRIFLTNGCDALPKYKRWYIDYEKLPDEITGKYNSEILSELKQMYEENPEKSFICQAFKALVDELETVRGFKVTMDFKGSYFIVSWDLSFGENT